MKIFLAILLACGLSGQVVYLPIHTAKDSINMEDIERLVLVQDTISAEELFLKKISDEALAKEEKRKVITNRILTVLVVILLVDKFVD